MIAKKFSARKPAHGTNFPKCQVPDTLPFDSQISTASAKLPVFYLFIERLKRDFYFLESFGIIERTRKRRLEARPCFGQHLCFD